MEVYWCRRGDSNSHALRQCILSAPRLPFRHSGECQRSVPQWCLPLHILTRTVPVGLRRCHAGQRLRHTRGVVVRAPYRYRPLQHFEVVSGCMFLSQ